MTKSTELDLWRLKPQTELVCESIAGYLYEIIVYGYPEISFFSTVPAFRGDPLPAVFKGSCEAESDDIAYKDRIIAGKRMVMLVQKQLLITEPIVACSLETATFHYQVF